jgi:hypothetical protein
LVGDKLLNLGSFFAYVSTVDDVAAEQLRNNNYAKYVSGGVAANGNLSYVIKLLKYK